MTRDGKQQQEIKVKQELKEESRHAFMIKKKKTLNMKDLMCIPLTDQINKASERHVQRTNVKSHRI